MKQDWPPPLPPPPEGDKADGCRGMVNGALISLVLWGLLIVLLYR